MWIIHIIEGVRFNGGHPLFFWEIFLHDLILPPGGIKTEFIMRETLLGENQSPKFRLKESSVLFRLDYRRKSLGTKIRLF